MPRSRAVTTNDRMYFTDFLMVVNFHRMDSRYPSSSTGARGQCRETSPVVEQWWKDDHDDRRPHGIDRQVVRLPPFESRERSTPSQKADVEHDGPRQIDQKDHVFTQGGHAIRAEAELGDARGDGPQSYRVGQ